ncbi:MAG: D-tyrosyl-tRNA(Tyr) deacylase [Clostridiales bacterium]|nr:D-tyrosyl-tRNA(Tyr) deacylase [Clostridiales bacterium]
MRTVVQRVRSSSVEIDGKIVGKIDKGLMILVGIRHDDTKKQVEWMADKIKKLRIFEDEDGKMNLSAKDVGAGYLIVSQFTLYGDCKKGTRPSFTDAAVPSVAIPLYEYFIELMKADGDNVQTGEFGADMLVSIENDGPVTMVIDRNNE